MSVPIATPNSSGPSTTSSNVNGVQLSTRIIRAAHAVRGGDWCETFVVSDDVIGLSIEDICGHGSEKFAAMVASRMLISKFAETFRRRSSTSACQKSVRRSDDKYGFPSTAAFNRELSDPTGPPPARTSDFSVRST